MNDNANPLRNASLDDEQFFALALRHLDGVAEAGEEAALIGRLRDNPDVRRRFVSLCRQIGMLHETMFSEAGEDAWGNDESGMMNDEWEMTRNDELGMINDEWGMTRHDESGMMNDEAESQQSDIYPSSPSHSAYPSFPSYPSLSPLAVGGPVFSYTAATLILGVMLLSAWAYKITHDYGALIVTNSRRSTTSGGAAPQYPELVFVGRVTGMNDCRWADPQTETFAGAAVPLGRKYALSSGLMEITYRSGAKVILEGPCRYEVESEAGGFLALGKLTARVEIKSEFGIRNSEFPGDRSFNSRISNSQFPIPNSELFSIRTPTALVTDLGTEFGVAVDENGDTISHVFQGSISVRAVEGPAASAAGGSDPKSQITLLVGQSARVEKDSKTGAARLSTGGENNPPPKFVRAIPQTRRSYIDLADVVAGGDGFGRARGRGINPSTGAAVGGAIGSFGAEGDGRYRRVEGMPLVDGVFVPDGGRGPVQLDSAGNVFAEFPDTDNFTWGYVWSGEYPKVKEDVPSPIAWLGGVNYSRPPHSVLCLPTNKGITFDLEAVRRANAALEIKRFIAVAGNTEQRTPQGDPRHERVSADVWVFVDGRLRFGKTDFNAEDGPVPIDVALTPADRFLTLATTDAGNTANFDWTMFGDPRLEISETIENRKEEQIRNP